MEKEIVQVFRLADALLIDQIGLEDHPATGLERLFDLRHERTLQVIEIQNHIVALRGKLDPSRSAFCQFTFKDFCSADRRASSPRQPGRYRSQALQSLAPPKR